MKRRQWTHFIFVLAVLGLILSACASPPEVTATPTLAPTQTTTSTATQTATPPPTATPTPLPYLGPAPEGAILRLGRGIARMAAWSPDGTRLAVASSTGIYLYDSATFAPIGSAASDQQINALAFSTDGTLLATGEGNFGENGQVVIRDGTSGQAIRSLGSGREGGITGVSFSPDGSQVAGVGDGGGTIWGVAGGAALVEFAGRNRVAFSPDGGALAAIIGSQPIDEQVVLIDPASGEIASYLFRTDTQQGVGGTAGGFADMAWSPDGTMLAATNYGGMLTVWEAASGSVRTYSGLPHVRDLQSEEFRRYVIYQPNGLAWSPDSTAVAVADTYQTALILDIASGEPRTIIPNVVYGGNPGQVAWSPDGALLAVAADSSRMAVWSASTGELIASLEGFTDRVERVAVSADGGRVATAGLEEGSGVASLWDAVTGELLGRPQGQNGITDVDFSPDGRTLVLRDYAGLMQWNPDSGAQGDLFGGPFGDQGEVIFSPDGARAAVTEVFGRRVTIYDMLNWSVIAPLPGNAIYAAWSPDGRWLATGWRTGVTLWDASAYREVLWMRTGVENVNSLSFSPDGSRLAAATFEQTITIWDTESGQVIATLPDLGHLVAWSPSGDALAVATRTGGLMLVDPQSGEIIRTLAGHNEYISDLAWSADGRVLVTGSSDGTVIVWDVGQ